MNAYATSGDSFGQHMEALWEHVEDEFHYAVGYVDRVIVPEARREAGSAARTVAGYLERLADRLHPLDPDRTNAGGPRNTECRQRSRDWEGGTSGL